MSTITDGTQGTCGIVVILQCHYCIVDIRYDEWIETDRLAGKATGPSSRHSGRSSYSRVCVTPTIIIEWLGHYLEFLCY